MNGKSILAGTSLALGAILVGCWWLASRPSSAVLAQAPGRAAEGAEPAPTVFELGPGAEEETVLAPAPDRSERARGLSRDPETRGPDPATAISTTILVTDSRTEEPVERFAIRISRVRLRTDHTSFAAPDRSRDFPGGALVVEIPLEGFSYSVQAPGYLDQAGRIETVSPTDRRALIRLEPIDRVRGRLVFEGRPAVGVAVALVGRSRKLELTDEQGTFEFEKLRAGTYSIRVKASGSGAFDFLTFGTGLAIEPEVLWTGNRCELEALAPGHYRITADVQERPKNKRSSGWKPTGTSFEGEVLVCGGDAATCVLRRE